tara:strand:- start:3564 stop:5021 length:1458 start_codon:yes stop_codon:yes gene_type:complete
MKKQRLKNYLKFGILLFGISILVINCQADEPLTFDNSAFINAKTVSFVEAKAFFEKGNNTKLAKNNGNNVLVLNPDWNSLEHSDLVYTDAQLTKADTDVNRLGDFSSELIFVNIDNQIQSIIVTTWVEEYDNTNNIVEATIYFNDYDGNFVDAYKIENGLFTKRLVPSQNVSTAGFFMFLQNLTDGDCWNTDNLPVDGAFDEVDLGTVSGGNGGNGGSNNNGSSSSGSGLGTGSGTGNSYGGYVNGAIGGGGGSVTRGGISVGAATIFMSPIDANHTVTQETQNHLTALNEFTTNNIIKTKINWLQGRLGLNNEFGYQFTETGNTYSFIAGTQNSIGDGISFPIPQENTTLETHTHHYGLDPVFSIEDVFNTAKFYNLHSNLNATSIVITTPTKMYALRIDNPTLANAFFNDYNNPQSFNLLRKSYTETVIEYAQWACDGNCSDTTYELYLNYYLNQLLLNLDSGLVLFAGLENADGSITWTNFN